MPRITMISLDLPDFWACPLMYGDESPLDDAADAAKLAAFEAWMVETYGSCRCVSVDEHEGGAPFRTYHDAHRFGVLACHTAGFTFDVSSCPKMAEVPAAKPANRNREHQIRPQRTR